LDGHDPDLAASGVGGDDDEVRRVLSVPRRGVLPEAPPFHGDLDPLILLTDN
jgi:hypothetical protein